MKKLLLTTLVLLSTGAAYALPVGNPSEASLLHEGIWFGGNCNATPCDTPCDPCASWCDAFSLRLGFYGDYVFNRHLAVRTDRRGNHDKDIEHTSITTNAGYIALNGWDRIDLFGTVGTTNFFIDSNASVFGLGAGSRFKLETSTHFSWSVGARGTLWECGCTSLGIEGQYFQARPDIKRISLADVVTVYPQNASTKYWEWQVGVGISHRINIFVPYIAVKWSGARLDLPAGLDLDAGDSIRNDKLWGYAVGCSIIDCEKAALTVEGRFADEKALYVNGQIRF